MQMIAGSLPAHTIKFLSLHSVTVPNFARIGNANSASSKSDPFGATAIAALSAVETDAALALTELASTLSGFSWSPNLVE